MRGLGYAYSNGTALCAVHATDTTDEHTESGRAYPLYNWEETHFDVTCDAPGCGEVILEQNCTDDCEVQP